MKMKISKSEVRNRVEAYDRYRIQLETKGAEHIGIDVCKYGINVPATGTMSVENSAVLVEALQFAINILEGELVVE